MKIDLYARCWNERDMLPFFFLHYDKLVQRYIIYDDASTDNSQEILRLNPKVELRPMPPYSDPESRIRSALALQETCWRESRGIADWVIITDIDEHLYHPDMYGYLAQCRAQGVTIIPALGYQMLSEHFPEHKTLLCQSLTRGACDLVYSKLGIFSPNEIDAVNYTQGRHSAAPKGRVVLPARDELLLLHYHYLGFERVRKRNAQFVTRQRKNDIAMGWGSEYSLSSKQLREVWNLIASRLVDISQPDLRPWETHGGPRWWRPPYLLRYWESDETPPWYSLPFMRRRRSIPVVLHSLISRVLKPCLPERLLKLLRKFKAPAPSSTEARVQGRIRRRLEVQSKGKASHEFSYEDALSLLDRLGIDPSQSREGSMPLASLQFMQSHFDRLDTSRPIIALHVGNFLGVSLAYLVHTLRRLHPDSRVVSIDPNLTHRGIPRTMETVLVLLNYFGLEDRVAILTGYSLEKNVSNQGEIFAGYDPVANWENERSCTHQLDLLNALARGVFDLCLMDGNHDGDYLQRELDRVRQLLRPGGLLVLDDVSTAWPEIQWFFNSISPDQFQKLSTDDRIGLLVRS
jgi:Glycosyl transferase family 2/Methyltransferase domain